jgi:phosphoribosylglycinamide formyltransferase-1
VRTERDSSKKHVPFIDSPSTSLYISSASSSNFSGKNGMNLAVFASGRGSNFQAILQAIDSGLLPAHVCVFVCSNSGIGAAEKARARKIPVAVLAQQAFSSEETFADEMVKVLAEHQATFIALAGYLKKIPARVVRTFQGRILNIHPALLPAFGGAGMYGHHVHEAVLASGATISGASVHLVDEEYDRGPVVMQKTVPVLAGDTADSLAARVLKVEHEIYPLALKAFAEGNVRIEGTHVWIIS